MCSLFLRLKYRNGQRINIINTNIPETQHEQIISIMPYAFQILLKKSTTTDKMKIIQNYPQHYSSILSSSGVTTIMILVCVQVHACLRVCMKSVQSCPTLATPWAVVHQTPLSMGFFRQEYQNGLPCPAPGDFPNPGIEPTSLPSPAMAGGFFTTSATWDPSL